MSRKRSAGISAVISLILFAISITAIAGPSAEDIDYSVARPLRVMTKVSNNIRFDIITPEAPHLNVDGGENASWYSDELLIVRQLDNGKILYSRELKSEKVEFIGTGRLSDDFVVIKEWSGGGSCCYLITAFQTLPTFKILLEHNNDFFDRTEIIAGREKLELHRLTEHATYPSSHSELPYTPSIFDLRRGKWE